MKPIKKKETPQLHPDLEGFNIIIDKFGNISSTKDISEINDFLNKNLKDKKFKYDQE
jgi:hypothetical protein